MVNIKLPGSSQQLLVSKGAYRAFYAPLGWVVQGQGKVVEQALEPVQKHLLPFEAPPVVLPSNVDEMSYNELRDYATEQGVNIKGLRTKGEVRKAILRSKGVGDADDNP
jgi:hypothetical protein